MSQTEKVGQQINNVPSPQNNIKKHNNWVNLTAGSSVALIAVKFSGRRRLPLALGLHLKSLAMPSQLLFLPGALGRTQLWEPVAALLTYPATKMLFGWPGFGSTPPDPLVNGIDDLVARVVAEVDQPTALIAQSMGGAIAVRVALEKPDLITHLVLAVTSGGVDVSKLGGQDWRPSFHESHPRLPCWFSIYQEDLSARLSRVTMPVLLLWGDSDPISPVRVGERLASLLPCAQLHVIQGGDHDLAETHASVIAPLIDEHLLMEAI